MQPYYDMNNVKIYTGHVLDVLQALEAESVACVVTSPPY
jgi:DNA modification methylase